jgi:hypothetical protein
MRKHLFITLCVLALSHASFTQDVNLAWAKSMGGNGEDVGNSVASDIYGNVYTTGVFIGTVDFDPGPGIYNLTPVDYGCYDLYVYKLDASGNFLWVKQIGGIHTQEANSITVDANGNSYTVGDFGDTVDFDPGVGTNFLTAEEDDNDGFVIKLDGSGNFLWAEQFDGNDVTVGYSVVVDAIGNVYTTGGFTGTTDFDPETGTNNLNSIGDWDIFIVKFTCSNIFYRDEDGDGYGSSVAITGCTTTPPEGYVSVGGDCIDNNPAIHPNATEICGNGIDDNCDGQIE